MNGQKGTNKHGFTLIELMITMAMGTIVILAVGVALVDSHRGWNKTYNHVFGEVVTDSYVARKAFDAVVRKATLKKSLLDIDGQFVEVYYYQDLNSTEPDRYANFYKSGDELFVDYGSLQPGTWNTQSPSSTVRLARNVLSANFSISGSAVQMLLSLSDEEWTMMVTSSAIRHNE